MKVHFSNQDNLRNFQGFTRSLDFTNTSTLQITTNEKWITVHPANLVLAAALAVKVGKQNAEIIGQVPESGRYLDRMGLYKLTRTESPFSYSDKEPAGRFVPISIIKTAADQSRFIAEMIPLLHLSEQNTTVIKYVIGELVRNVLEHAYTVDGAIVAAQYYKKTNRISIGICDTGIGILKSMQPVWKPKTDLDAIKLALMPGITGTTLREGGTSENAGAGLFFIKSIAKIARSYFVLYSGSAEYTLLKYRSDIKGPPTLYADPFRDRNTKTNETKNFQGTLVAIDILLDESPELQSLLKAIGKVYDDAIRERKRAIYKGPKFI